MHRGTITLTVLLTIASVVAGYFLSIEANKRCNILFFDNLRAELDLVDGQYEKMITENQQLDEATKKYLQARRDYLNNRLGMAKAVGKMNGNYA